LPEFSALENVCIPGWLGVQKKAVVKEKAEEILIMLGLKERLQNKPKLYLEASSRGWPLPVH
jgi:lipoprotein-releasing system ATP-binding protein